MALVEAVGQIVYGPLLAGLAVAIVACQIVVIVLATRRRRRGGVPLPLRVHAMAGVVIAALPIVAGISVHAARALMFAAFSSTSGLEPGEKATAIARGISGQINAIPLGASTTLLALALWVAGIALTLSVPRSDGRARSFPPPALVVVGLVPVVYGAVDWAAGIIKGFADSAGLPPEEKSALIDRLLDTMRLRLTHFTRVATGAIAVFAIVAVVLIVRRARAGAEVSAPARSPRLPLAISAGAIVLAALLMIEARPIAAENETPWPPTAGAQFVWSGGPPTPNLVGPDPAERAPVVSVFRDGVKLDAAPVNDLTDLELKLGTLANNYRLLHPGGDFNEMALIEADATTSIARLASVLRAVRGAWYYHPMFAFTERQTHVRPAFGRIERVVMTGARCRLAYGDDHPDDWDDAAVAEWKVAVPLRIEDFTDYGAFARRLVELRRQGKVVLVKFDRPALR